MANGETVASLDVTLDSIYEVDVSTNITADAYSSETTYNVGDYVIYAKFLYKCKTEISEPEEFDAEKWDKVKLANEVESLSEEVDTKADADTVYTKTEVDTALASKADSDTVYTKAETDTLLSEKANIEDVYAKSDVDTLLASKADVSTTYTKTEVDTALEGKADAATTYTKTEVDNALAAKADSATTYTKSETDTLLNAKADASNVYTKTDVDTLLGDKADANNTYTKTEVDTALQSKADANNVYSKSEVYTKSETDTALANKADSSSVYTKDEVYNKTQVDTIIDNLPEPMIFKGTLGEEGTITDLPSAGSSNEGFTYKVITAGTYASIVAKVGDVFVSNGSEWVLIPAGDTDSDSWRNIKVNGTEKLGSAISSGALDFTDTTNVKVSFDPSENKIQFTLDGIYTSSEVDTALSAKADSTDVYTKTETYSKTDVYNKTETYNKAEVDGKVGKPEFTKSFTPTPIATLTDGAENVPMKSLVVDIVPKQASGTPTPSSPLPISGFSSVTAYQNSKNLVILSEKAESTANGIKSKVESDNLIVASGTSTANAGDIAITTPETYLKAGTYTVSFNGIDTRDSTLICYLRDKTSGLGNRGDLASSKHSYQVTLTNDITLVGVLLRTTSTHTITMNAKFQIEVGSTASTYESPTQQNTSTKELPRIIYGGEVDVVSGSGTETRWYKKFKWSEGTNVVSLGNYTRKIFNFETTGYNVYPQTAAYPQLCNVAEYLANFNTDSLHFYANANSIIVFLPNDTDGDTEIEVTGELATPTPIATTPTTIKTMGGTENIFADCGDVSGEYYTEQADDIIDLHNAIDAEKETVLTGTLEAGETEITFTSDKITTDSLIDVYTSPVGVNYSAIAVSSGEVVITFAEQASDIGVKVVIK